MRLHETKRRYLSLAPRYKRNGLGYKFFQRVNSVPARRYGILMTHVRPRWQCAEGDHVRIARGIFTDRFVSRRCKGACDFRHGWSVTCRNENLPITTVLSGFHFIPNLITDRLPNFIRSYVTSPSAKSTRSRRIAALSATTIKIERGSRERIPRRAASLPRKRLTHVIVNR